MHELLTARCNQSTSECDKCTEHCTVYELRICRFGCCLTVCFTKHQDDLPQPYCMKFKKNVSAITPAWQNIIVLVRERTHKHLQTQWRQCSTWQNYKWLINKHLLTRITQCEPFFLIHTCTGPVFILADPHSNTLNWPLSVNLHACGSADTELIAHAG